jgi:hypothetical protein
MAICHQWQLPRGIAAGSYGHGYTVAVWPQGSVLEPGVWLLEHYRSGLGIFLHHCATAGTKPRLASMFDEAEMINLVY